MSELIDWEKDFQGEFLVVTSEFPLGENSDSGGSLGRLVRRKIRQYREAGFRVDAVLANINDKEGKYGDKGEEIYKVSFDDLRNIIQRRKYKKILIFGLSPEIVHAVLACDLDEIEVLVYVEEGCRYLGLENGEELVGIGKKVNEARISAMRLFEKNLAVKWVFESRGEYKRISKETGVRFKNRAIVAFESDLGRDEEKMLRAKVKVRNRLARKGKGRRTGWPILTVVIPAYNVEQYIENTVKSVVDVENINFLELVIVDDGSTDRTGEIVREMIKKASSEVKKAIVHEKQENGGHGAAVDKGLALAHGKYFRVLDADDRFDSEELDRHIEVLKNTEADAVFTDVVRDFSVGSVYVEDKRYSYMEPGKVYDFEELYEKKGDEEFNGPSIMTTTMRTEKLRESGCRHPRKVSYDDMILCYYMLKAMETVQYDARFLHYYYIGREGQSTSVESYKRKFREHLEISERLIQLLEEGELSEGKRKFQMQHRIEESLKHDYLVALVFWNEYGKYKQIEEMLKKYPKYYRDESLVPGYVVRMRKFGYPYFWARKMKMKIQEGKK